MCTEHHQYKRRSGRLFERWVTISTGCPISKVQLQTTPYNRTFLSSIPEDITTDSVDISTDISLGRELNIAQAVSHQTIAEMDGETRVATLETDVSNLKSDMGAVHEKLDKLLQSFTNLSIQREPPVNSLPEAPKATHTTPALDGQQPPERPSALQGATGATHDANTTGYNTTTRPQHASHPNHLHHLVGRDISADAFIQREMDKDKFDFTTHGRYIYSSDVNASRVMAKPYMYMYREGIFSMKQRLEARQTITLNEYVDAILALLADKRAYDPKDYIDIMHHLRKVVRDALERQWCAVRRWTQYVWDSVEAGAMTWSDRDLIQEERVR